MRSGVGRIGQQREYSLFAIMRKARELGHFSIHGRLIEFEIAALDDGSNRSCDRQSASVGNRMADTNKFNFKRPDLHDITGFDLMRMQRFRINGMFA